MADLRRKILDASVALVAEHGVRNVSFREVARRAGVSHQAPYHIFGNYQGILTEVAREGFAALTHAMASAAARESEPLDALERAGQAYIDFARDNVGHFRVMFQHSLVDIHAGECPEAEATHGTLVRLAQAVVDAGHARVPAEILAPMAWATVHGYANLITEGILAGKALSPEEERSLGSAVIHGLAQLLRQ